MLATTLFQSNMSKATVKQLKRRAKGHGKEHREWKFSFPLLLWGEKCGKASRIGAASCEPRFPSECEWDWERTAFLSPLGCETESERLRVLKSFSLLARGNKKKTSSVTKLEKITRPTVGKYVPAKLESTLLTFVIRRFRRALQSGASLGCGVMIVVGARGHLRTCDILFHWSIIKTTNKLPAKQFRKVSH